MNLVEVDCPDCTNGWVKALPVIRTFMKCDTCGGKGKVLVKREDLIKVGGR